MRKMMSKTKLENLPVTSRPSRRRSDGLWKRACNVHQSSIICFPVWGHELLWSSVISFWKSWSCGQMWTMWTMDCRKSCCLNKPFACCDTGPKLATGQVHGQVWGQLQETTNAKHWRICCKNGKMLVASQALFLFILFSPHTLKCSQSFQSSHSSQSSHPSQSSQSNSRRALGARILSHLASQLDTIGHYQTILRNLGEEFFKAMGRWAASCWPWGLYEIDEVDEIPRRFFQELWKLLDADEGHSWPSDRRVIFLLGKVVGCTTPHIFPIEVGTWA